MYKNNTIFFVLLVSLAVLGAYVVFNPATSCFAPKCAFKALTGYDCPSCGGQRAAHALLNGKIEDAFKFNPFLFIAIPYLAVVAYTAFSNHKFASKLKPIVQHPATIGAYLLAYIAWWILRNTNFYLSLW